MDQDLGALPEFYSFTSEALFHIELPVTIDNHGEAVVLSTRQEYYDYRQKGKKRYHMNAFQFSLKIPSYCFLSLGLVVVMRVCNLFLYK